MKKLFLFIAGLCIVFAVTALITTLTHNPGHILIGFAFIIITLITLPLLKIKIERIFYFSVGLAIVLIFILYPNYHELTAPDRIIYWNKKKITTNPDDASAYYKIGIAYIRLHKPEDAERNLEIAKSLYKKQNDREGVANVEKQIKDLIK